MSYYTMPKNNNTKIKLNIRTTDANDISAFQPYLSKSLHQCINTASSQLLKLQNNCDRNACILDNINKIVNPFEFMHSIVPGCTKSVSKVKSESISFFELMDLFQMFSICDHFCDDACIPIACISFNYTSATHLLNLVREDNNDAILEMQFDASMIHQTFIKSTQQQYQFQLIIMEFNPFDYTDPCKYVSNMLVALQLILKTQCDDGICIIKIDNIFHKTIVDVIFMLSCVYDKLYIAKPLISNVTTGERYLVCKGFHCNSTIACNLAALLSYNPLDNTSAFVSSLVDNDLPCCLLNKLEESNLVVGQQQIESFDQITNIFKNKNRDEKIEALKKTHVQKCIHWCEKNQLPHNKFNEKVNIFKPVEDTLI